MQHYFVFLSFEVLSASNYDKDFFYNEMEELGLYSKISVGTALHQLPEGTFISEYQAKTMEDLKNLVYTEVSELFHKYGISARLFISVSEQATIGLEDVMNTASSAQDSDAPFSVSDFDESDDSHSSR